MLQGKTVEQIKNETLENVPAKTSVTVVVGTVYVPRASRTATIPLPSGYERSQCRYWVESILLSPETYDWELRGRISDVNQATGVIGNLYPDKTYYYLCIAVKEMR